MRIVIVTDAWAPQINGVVRTLQATRAALIDARHDVFVISPDMFPSVPCPTYHEIRLALVRPGKVGAMIEAFGADAVHLSTEGPLCLSARSWLRRNGFAFTTAYHTQFPQYVAARTGISPAIVWSYIRWFHRPACAVLAATPTVEAELVSHGLTSVRRWGRGVDLAQFCSEGPLHPTVSSMPRPILLYVGRVAVEKNIDAFLGLQHQGTKVVVGEGPTKGVLEELYPSAVFVGALSGAELASAYRSADVLVFPSRTDTFGLVMIEALACGTPVAALPVAGPIDVLVPEVAGMASDLSGAVTSALQKSRRDCAAYGKSFSWSASAAQFEAALVPIRPTFLATPSRSAYWRAPWGPELYPKKISGLVEPRRSRQDRYGS